ncbi:UDP-3-O-[3-hydroxymyristoyl] glucosamine N-acyltransferase (EC 2.3.1.191) [uncultured Gammaproteobacteria bacterium]|uniref:UDP-3-O-(3-hydroxymyristoyl)glucosamine N-acyltransferase n=1 Tax=Bathymodiolus heckerae thiotrophic gill symbiont TaxID=1052212 RepID=UPI0010B6F1E0|nr:UDP-3-O-(3-hydroxymyristoyl)glucosamine N-acyltransferase [Bathymodiolus heckerae thiotrophic gill symbiont]CAC9433535.1 UDP-3-O-[3-hydroxymyristoyl] glucosamine N-acyltransferase (EC 2.3.1.191) [uncultured Gammaproteobacteria bacterium]SMN13092.1 UDP-3-O-[3-hydroxymyristoyl] glucosamine N-acyltransferase [Bathymodiolus heckerae thiotrophic gill symbiont]SMN14617.1 UDP-3-O-[3-hydroxymyristoyl] glucosamine N-acyltransferase [uncultured Candidatus Thioglobus sp.]
MYTLGELADFINAEVIGDELLNITGLASSTNAQKNQLTYISSAKYKSDLINSMAGAVILTKDLLDDCPTNALVVDNVYLAFAKISHYFKQQPTHLNGIHTSAKINSQNIANSCTIGEGVVIGKNCTIGANTTIEQGVSIANNASIQANVTILQNSIIGNNVVISAGVVIGSEGFGNALDSQSRWHSIAHLGNVMIGNDVTIGANTVIDRGTLEDTQIHSGVRLDNLVHIAHNVILGANTAIAAGVTIGGSAILGKRCQVGGGAVIASHMCLADDVVVTGASTVDKHLSSGHYTGFTSISTHSNWKRSQFWLLKLDKIAKYLNITPKNLKRK